MKVNSPLRSLLFVPGSKPRMLERARSMPVDWVILDLEDGVAMGEKVGARTSVREALEEGGFEPRVAVRVNSFTSGMTEDDLQETLVDGVSAICLPKVETEEDVRRMASLLDAKEWEQHLRAGEIQLLVMIETALGVLNAHAVARASSRVIGLCLGGEDLAADLGAQRTQAGSELSYSRERLVLCARAAGVRAIDTIWTNLCDDDGLLEEARRARQLGYSGKLVIHPRQIETIHQAFAPTASELAYARRVVEAFHEAERRGDGVTTVDDCMVDAPVYLRAREILANAADSHVQSCMAM